MFQFGITRLYQTGMYRMLKRQAMSSIPKGFTAGSETKLAVPKDMFNSKLSPLSFNVYQK